MKSRLGLNVIYLITVLIVLSLFVLFVVEKSRGSLLVREDDAIQAAATYLAKKDIRVNTANADATFVSGNWNVFFFVNPDKRPAGILVKVNPINGNAEIIPLK